MLARIRYCGLMAALLGSGVARAEMTEAEWQALGDDEFRQAVKLEFGVQLPKTMYCDLRDSIPALPLRCFLEGEQDLTFIIDKITDPKVDLGPALDGIPESEMWAVPPHDLKLPVAMAFTPVIYSKWTWFYERSAVCVAGYETMDLADGETMPVATSLCVWNMPAEAGGERVAMTFKAFSLGIPGELPQGFPHDMPVDFLLPTLYAARKSWLWF